jgi:hypothetical protein
MKLSILERLTLFHTLPREGDFTTLKALRVLREALTLSEEEKTAFHFVVDKSGIANWDDNAPEADIHINEVLTEAIKKVLVELNTQKKLTDNQVSIYEKFVVGKRSIAATKKKAASKKRGVKKNGDSKASGKTAADGK